MSSLAHSFQSDRIASLIKVKAISRQYHSYFDWDGKNPNKFLSLFGNTFRDKVTVEMKENPQLIDGCQTFLKLGQKRNILVHENFANAPIDWTLEEIMQMYRSAFDFVNSLSKRIHTD